MILTVTLNLGLDVTYHVDQLQPHESHRVRAASTQAGGKGVNVARVLHALNHETLVMGLAGGGTGAAVRDDLDASGLPSELVAMSGENRRTVAVVSHQAGDATVFNEAGPHVGEQEWQAFVDRFSAVLPRATVVVLSGSLPPGIPSDAYAVLTRLAEAGAVPVTAAAALRESGARAVVASLGPAGVLAVTPDGTWRARPPARLGGNPGPTHPWRRSMPLGQTGDIVGRAAAQRRGVGAFNVIQLEHAEAFVAGAEAAGAPVILQISENTVRYHGALAPIGLAALALGTSHAMLARDGALDLEFIARLRAVVGVPLVLHASRDAVAAEVVRLLQVLKATNAPQHGSGRA